MTIITILTKNSEMIYLMNWLDIKLKPAEFIILLIVLKVLSENAPVNKGHVWANEAPFMNKVLKKEIMKNYNIGTSFWKKKHLEVE